MKLPAVLAPYSKLIAAIITAIAAGIASGLDPRVILVSVLGVLTTFLMPANVPAP